ncbi:hypothetical protein PCL_06389 [Purpureocillium lilacinum]|uniref:Uncharacterized protein n=1 Tax=Purpureocillium lilacinum TaxID=33203 RepID=A0A2U3EMJ7_PURLI|nr:hypothetical protein PCL_06389 [Purpureocillium lilacinum]
MAKFPGTMEGEDDPQNWALASINGMDGWMGGRMGREKLQPVRVARLLLRLLRGPQGGDGAMPLLPWATGARPAEGETGHRRWEMADSMQARWWRDASPPTTLVRRTHLGTPPLDKPPPGNKAQPGHMRHCVMRVSSPPAPWQSLQGLWSGGSGRRGAAGEMYSCGLLGSINDHVSPMYPDADPMPRPPGPWRARRETPARQQQRMAVAHPCQMPDSVAVWDGDSRSCVAGSSRLSGVPERQQAAATGGCCGGRSAPAKIRLFACSPAPSISAVSRAVVCTCSHGRTGSWCMWDVAHGVNEVRRRDGSVEVPASPSLSSPMAVVVNRCRVGLWGGGGDAVAGFSEPWRHVRRKSKNAKEVESGFQNLGGGNSDQSNQVAALPYVRPVVTSHAATPTPASWRGECRPSGWLWRTLHTGQHQGRQVLALIPRLRHSGHVCLACFGDRASPMRGGRRGQSYRRRDATGRSGSGGRARRRRMQCAVPVSSRRPERAQRADPVNIPLRQAALPARLARLAWRRDS